MSERPGAFPPHLRFVPRIWNTRTHGARWKERGWSERVSASTNRSKMVGSIPFPRPSCCPLTGPSIQAALRAFLQPIKTEDPRVDFYTMYKKESLEYDTEYVKKYEEDLNTTLIFVRYLLPYLANHLTYSLRPACSLPSAPPLSSTPILISNPIPTNNRPPSSEPSSLLSTNPPFPARPPPFRPFREAQRARSSSQHA